MTRFLQDILNEPAELLGCLHRLAHGGGAPLARAAGLVRGAQGIIVCGIGSSWHAALAAQAVFHSCDTPCLVMDASELLHSPAIAHASAIILLSRSGKSVEIVRLLPLLKQCEARIIALTNAPESPLAREADATIHLNAAFDHMVSVTMYSGLALAAGLLAALSCRGLRADLVDALRAALHEAGERVPHWRALAEESGWFAAEGPAYLLARGASLASAHETRLTWEEAAKSPATALSTGGFRHGPQEMLAPGSRVALWVGNEWMREQDLALARDLRRCGACVLVIGPRIPPETGDLVLEIPPLPEPWQFVIDIIPAQLAAERLARLRRQDPDSFRYCPYIVEEESGFGAIP
jgi:glucosamine--fructose-6-phosphate aminotransferase (isomerizing)